MKMEKFFLSCLVSALASSMLVFTACSKSETPEKVVENYFKAQSTGNVAEAKKCISPDGVDFLEFTEKAVGAEGMKVVNEGNKRLFSGASFKFGDAVYYADDAIVKVTVAKGGDALDFNVRVRRYDGKWLLPLFSISNVNPEMVKLLAFLQVTNGVKPVAPDAVQKNVSCEVVK